MNKSVLVTILLLCSHLTHLAASDPIKLSFRSRALLDAAISDYGTQQLNGYYRVEDFRLGFKALYEQYEIKADLGLGGNKLAIKDLMINYHFSNSVVTVGNAYEPFSLDMLISTFDLRFHQSASSALAFTNSRKLGATYHLYLPSLYFATGIYTHNDINKIGKDQVNAFVTTTRFVWRNMGANHRVLHAGGAFSYRTKEHTDGRTPQRTLSSTGVTSLFSAPLLEASLESAGSEAKGCFELLGLFPRAMVQAEYFLNRHKVGNHHYRPQGGYIQGGFLVWGKGFCYDSMYGIPGRPHSAKALEITLRYNYTDMNDRRASIMGGSEHDLSLGANLYLNKHLAVKLNTSYVFVGKECNSFYNKNLWLTQMRLQYIF